MNQRLIDKYLKGTCTDAERQAVEAWYADYLATLGEPYAGDQQAMDEAAIRSLAAISRRIQPIAKSPRRLSLWRWAAAAVVLLAVVFGGYQYFQQSPAGPLLVNDVLPGGNQARLELADGRSIVLNDVQEGVLAEEAGIQISKTEDGLLVYEVLATETAALSGHNTIVTPRGGRYQVLLPDGTKVWLNASSSLRYPLNFSGGQREVELHGEGYFDVVQRANNSGDPDSKWPFVVVAGKQRITVLGTQFNINAYADEDATRTTLVSGRVVVSNRNAPQHQLKLQPGQSGVTDSRGTRLAEIDLESAISWKNNYFYFKDQHIAVILRELSRWYDVDIEYAKGVDTANLYYSGSVSNDKNLSEALRVMELTGNVKFKIEGRRVTVMN